MWWCWRRNKSDKEYILKYTVIKPIQYSMVTGNRTRKGTRERTLVRHDIGDVVDLEDGLADKFYNRLEPYFEPKPKVTRKPKPDESVEDTRTFAEKLGFKEATDGG